MPLFRHNAPFIPKSLLQWFRNKQPTLAAPISSLLHPPVGRKLVSSWCQCHLLLPNPVQSPTFRDMTSINHVPTWTSVSPLETLSKPNPSTSHLGISFDHIWHSGTLILPQVILTCHQVWNHWPAQSLKLAWLSICLHSPGASETWKLFPNIIPRTHPWRSPPLAVALTLSPIYTPPEGVNLFSFSDDCSQIQVSTSLGL